MYPLRIPGVEKVNLRRGCSQVSWAVTGPHLTAPHTLAPPAPSLFLLFQKSIKIRSCRTNFKTGFFCLIICDPHPQFGTTPIHRSMSTVFDCHQHACAASVKFLYGSFLSNFHKKIKKPKRWNFDFSIPVWIFEVTFSVKIVYFPQTSIFFQISLKQLNFQLLHSSLPWEKRKIPNQTAPCHPDREINFSVFFQFNFRTKSYSVFSEILTIHFPDFRFFPLNRSPQPEFNHPNFSV